MLDHERFLPTDLLDWLDGIDFTDTDNVLAAFSSTGRRAGKAAVAVPARGTWALDELARAAIVTRAQPRIALADLWAHGDNRERQALLKVLPDLPEPRRFEAIARDGCRSNVMTVFEAIACDNPYPRTYFEQSAWNQMVLKAVFCGVSVLKIDGLDVRANPELARMATDYAAERRAAGRSVSADLTLLASGEGA